MMMGLFHWARALPSRRLLQGTREAWSEARGIVRTDRELHKLFTQVALRYRERPGGFTRLVRAGWRERDAAPVAFVE